MAGENSHSRSVFHFSVFFFFWQKIYIKKLGYFLENVINFEVTYKKESKSNSHSLPTQKKTSKVLWFGLHFVK